MSDGQCKIEEVGAMEAVRMREEERMWRELKEIESKLEVDSDHQQRDARGVN